ncbi:hypothetical protein U1Q18_006625 [Sarracenia purpurea var. burkii]
MSKPLKKSLHECLSKVKNAPTPHLHLPTKTLSSWILRGCKHPKTGSFAVDRSPNHDPGKDDDEAATLEDVDRFLYENFKSFYLKDGNNDDNDDDVDVGNKNGSCDRKDDDDDDERTEGLLLESPRLMDPLSDLCGSHRFFVTPGSSGSLMEEARISATTSEDMCSASTTTATTSSSTTTATGTTAATIESTTTRGSDSAKKEMGPDEFIAVFTYSPRRYDEFMHSMQEMIEARQNRGGKVDWEFMEELLFWYLDLNDKRSYKYILSVFVDLVVVLRQNSDRIPTRSRLVRSSRSGRK